MRDGEGELRGCLERVLLSEPGMNRLLMYFPKQLWAERGEYVSLKRYEMLFTVP